MNGSEKMCIETLQARYVEELDCLVDELTTDKIIYDVSYLYVGHNWQATVFYDDINEEV